MDLLVEEVGRLAAKLNTGDLALQWVDLRRGVSSMTYTFQVRAIRHGPHA